MIDIEIATTTGPKKIQAERVAKTPFVIFDNRKHGLITNYRWSVTHIHSGYAAVHAKTKTGARRAAQQLSALDIDWALSPAELKESAKDCREKIVEIRAQAMRNEI